MPSIRSMRFILDSLIKDLFCHFLSLRFCLSEDKPVIANARRYLQL